MNETHYARIFAWQNSKDAIHVILKIEAIKRRSQSDFYLQLSKIHLLGMQYKEVCSILVLCMKNQIVYLLKKSTFR